MARTQTRLARRTFDGTLPHVEPDLDDIVVRLINARKLIAGLPHRQRPADHGHAEDSVEERDMAKVIAAYELLDDIDHALPSIWCWCVVKLYRPRDDGHVSPPALWTGHTTREQAELYAPAIAAHYKGGDSRFADRPDPTPDAEGYDAKWGDRFAVRQLAARPHDIIHPDLPVAEYVRGLG